MARFERNLYLEEFICGDEFQNKDLLIYLSAIYLEVEWNLKEFIWKHLNKKKNNIMNDRAPNLDIFWGSMIGK